MREAWKVLLFAQFHDTICGTCVASVYERIRGEFASADASLQRVLDRASQPSLRSNGQQVAFRGWASSGRGVGVMDTLGGNQRTLTEFVEDGSPSYSP